MSYLRFLSSQLLKNPDGRELPAMVAAIHWAKHFSDEAFVGEPTFLEKDVSASTTTWEDTRWSEFDKLRIQGRAEFMELYPNDYRAVRVVSDNSYWYICGPVDVMRQVAEAIGYPVESVT